MKHIEQITSEQVIDEINRLALSDDMLTTALSEPYAQATGIEVQPSAPVTSDVEEMPSWMTYLLRKIFGTIATVFRGVSLLSEFRAVYSWLRERLKGSADGTIPSIILATNKPMSEHLRLLNSRVISIDVYPDLPDGIDLLAFLSSDKALTDTITEYTDTNYDWVYKVDRLTLFPNIKKATFNMKEINIDMLKSNTVIEEVHFPRLTKIDTSMVAGTYNYSAHVILDCINLRVIDMPNVEEIYGNIRWQDMVYMSAKGSEVMEFPKLRYVRPNSNASMFHFSDCRIFKLPALETMYSANAAFITGWANLEELYMTRLEKFSGAVAWHILFENMPKLKKVVFGHYLTDTFRQVNYQGIQINGTWYYGSAVCNNCPNLIHLEFDGKKEDLYLVYWNPKYALLTEDLEEGVTDADGNTTTVYTAKNSLVDNGKFETNLEQFLYNFQTYIADRLADMTGNTAPTLTLSYEVYTALENQDEQTILATLTDKNWTVTHIPQIPSA